VDAISRIKREIVEAEKERDKWTERNNEVAVWYYMGKLVAFEAVLRIIHEKGGDEK